MICLQEETLTLYSEALQTHEGNYAMKDPSLPIDRRLNCNLEGHDEESIVLSNS